MQIISRFKQYGFKNSFLRIFKLIIRHIGLRYEDYILFKQKIELQKIDVDDISPKYAIKKLTLDDYQNSIGLKFDNRKINIFKSRFQDANYEAYGVFDKNILIYSSWISTNQFDNSMRVFGLKLNSDEGLLLDIITHPDYRRQGLHNFMNIYCLERIIDKGKPKAVVLILNENVPAIKSQEKCGFKRNKQISHFKLLGKDIVKIKNL